MSFGVIGRAGQTEVAARLFTSRGLRDLECFIYGHLKPAYPSILYPSRSHGRSVAFILAILLVARSLTSTSVRPFVWWGSHIKLFYFIVF
jgi:hypothetical protein